MNEHPRIENKVLSTREWPDERFLDQHGAEGWSLRTIIHDVHGERFIIYMDREVPS